MPTDCRARRALAFLALALAFVLVPNAAKAGEGERRLSWYDTPMGDPSRVSLHTHFEAQLIGPAFGPRVEALYRPFRAERGANLVAGVGLQGGPEFFYLPVSVGWRQHFRPHRIVTLELGAGYEFQAFFVPDIEPASRSAFYGEGGIGFRVVEQGWLGVQSAASWAPFERPGPGLAVRLGFRWDFR